MRRHTRKIDGSKQTSELIEIISHQLIKYRLLRGMSQEDLAAHSDVSVQTIYALEKKLSTFAKTTTLEKLAKALDIEPQTLLFDFNEQESQALSTFLNLMENPHFVTVLKKFL